MTTDLSAFYLSLTSAVSALAVNLLSKSNHKHPHKLFDLLSKDPHKSGKTGIVNTSLILSIPNSALRMYSATAHYQPTLPPNSHESIEFNSRINF
jgi:hypothetical protein